LIQCPISGRRITLLEGFFFSVRLQPIVGADVDALLLAREDFAPSLERATTLAVEQILGTLRLGTEKGHLEKRTVSAAAAAGSDEFDPVFQFCDRPFHSGPVDLLAQPSSWPVERSLRRKGEVVKETHDPISKSLSAAASFTDESIPIQTCLRILLKKIEAISLRKGEFADPFLPIGSEFF
jgi:hypothetical protein